MTATLSPDNQRRLVLLRVAALAATLCLSVAAVPIFRILPPLPLLFGTWGAWACFALFAFAQDRQGRPLGEHQAFFHLCLDIVFLTGWLTFCGGVANPLTALYLLPVAAAAAVLPPPHAWASVLFSSTAYGLLWIVAVPITVEDMERMASMHLLGMGLTFVLSALLIVGIVGRMGAALRERDRRLSAARERALMDERIVALGSLAAGAAHALGTPLNTMTLLAEEIAANAPMVGTLGEDAQELRLQVARCRDIVTGLLEEANLSSASGRHETLEAWLQRLIRHFRHRRPEAAPVLAITPDLAPVIIQAEPTVSQAIADVLENAAEANPVGLGLRLHGTGAMLVFTISDQGAGFSSTALARIGRAPYTSKSHGMGLGLFLAHATTERLGGHVVCRNTEAGAEVSLIIPRNALEVAPS